MPTAKTKKLTEALDILVEYGYLDDETPYHKAVSNAVNDFSVDQTLGGENNRDYLSILQNEARKELKLRRKKITGASFKKGSSVGGAQKVAADTTGASGLTIRPDKSLNPNIDFDSPEEKDTGGLLAPLQAINGSLNNINQTLVDGAKGDKKAADDARKAAEKKKILSREEAED